MVRSSWSWVTSSGMPGIATVCSQSRQPSLESGAHRRLNTIARTSASASKLRRDERKAARTASAKPSSVHSSWRA